MNLVLASASPRRRDLLAQVGIACTVEPASINEDALPGEPAAAYVQRLALEKAQWIYSLHRERGGSISDLLVLGADTVVVLTDGTILGKSAGDTPEARRTDAVRMLGLLSGRTHAVMTGVAVVSTAGSVVEVEITNVTMNILLPSEIEAYVASGEPLDKAGAYAIQGYAARWIPRIEGDYSNVVGLPLARVVTLLAQAGNPPVFP